MKNEKQASMDQLKRVSNEDLRILSIERNKMIKEVLEEISQERQKFEILESKYQGYKTNPPFLCSKSEALRIMVQEATRDCSNVELCGQQAMIV